MPDPQTRAPSVRPLGSIDWTEKDARWLAGGRRLQIVLAILLMALMFTPARIVESGEWGDRQEFGSSTRPAPPHAPGTYWRWSVFLQDGYSRGEPDPSEQPPSLSAWFGRWVLTLLPALMSLALAAGLLLRPFGRALLLIFIGVLPLTQAISPAHHPLAAVRHSDPAPFFMRESGGISVWGSGSLGEAAFFDDYMSLVLLVVAVGAHRGVMRGAGGAARQVVPLAASLPFFVPLAVLTMAQIAAGDYRALLGPQMQFFDAAECFRWPRLAMFGACRTGLFIFGLQSLVNGFAADRRIAAGAFVVGALGLACGIGISVLEAAEVGCFFWRTDIRYDWMVNSGIAIHRLMPPAVGMVLIVGGVARLLVAVSRPRQGGGK